eukprot:SAG22_NODE_8134_length_680_cov_0.948365_2_plen_56_part_01
MNGDTDDRDVVGHRGIELEQAPRPAEHPARVEQEERIRVPNVVQQVAEVGQVVGVE